MLAVELDWEGRELKLINNTGEIESERQQETRAYLVVPLCQKCHQSGLVNITNLESLTEEEVEENQYLPEVIIIDSVSDLDLIANENYFHCPGCVNDEVEFPRWHHSDEMYLPIDLCRGCERIIFSKSKYSSKESETKCDCEFTDEDEDGICIDCGLPMLFED